MHKTVYGRELSAVGQNSRAAHFAGINVEQTTCIAYLLSGLLAAFGGLLLSGRVSGAFLEMGTPFLLQSVGAVVVGGSSIVGGMGTPLGTLLGSIFLAMIVTTMAVLRVPGGFQDMIQGILIILGPRSCCGSSKSDARQRLLSNLQSRQRSEASDRVNARSRSLRVPAG